MNTNTSSKLRKLRRIQKLKRQRNNALIFTLIFLIAIVHTTFSIKVNSEDQYGVVAVVVEKGDTLWSIAEEYKPDGIEIREYIYEISKSNGIDNSPLSIGQTIYVPDMSK